MPIIPRDAPGPSNSSPPRKRSPTRMRPIARDSASQKRRAHALFYDDTAENVKGANPRGRHPAVHTMLLTASLTIQQLQTALDFFRQRSAVAAEDPAAAVPFFFFDFDGTLSVGDGLLNLGHNNMETLFGGVERRRILRATLGTMVMANQCYVLTANMAYQKVSEVLNELLAAGGAGKGFDDARFAADDTVRFVPAGGKLRALEEIIAARNFVLVRQ